MTLNLVDIKVNIDNYFEFDPILAISDECLRAGTLYRHRQRRVALIHPPPTNELMQTVFTLLIPP